MSQTGTDPRTWATELGETPDWRVVAEDVTPLPVPMMFFPEE